MAKWFKNIPSKRLVQHISQIVFLDNIYHITAITSHGVL